MTLMRRFRDFRLWLATFRYHAHSRQLCHKRQRS